MTRFGLDSTAEIPVAAHHLVGSTVALRYLSRFTPKVVTAGEHKRYRAAGIDLVLVFEDFGRPDRQGYADGKADAEFALKQSHAILGSPARRARYRFAADYDPAGHPELTDAYFDGVAAVIPRRDCGPYGSDVMVAHQHGRGFGCLWQTYAWSGGRFYSSPDNSVYQYSNGHTVAGIGADYNHLFGDDFGQWDFRPPSPKIDPRYSRFPKGPYPWKGKLLHEHDAVVEYDRLRKHPLIHRRRLGELRRELRDCADRIFFLVHQDAQWGAFVLPPAWLAYHRGWRYQQLVQRWQGKRLV